RQVAVIKAEETGQSTIIEKEKTAEAERLAAEIKAKTMLIDAEAQKNAAEKDAEARKIMAEATAAEEATIGLSEAQVIEAKAKAMEQEGMIAAAILEQKARAEAIGIEVKSEAERKQGLAVAEVAEQQGLVDAKVIEQKSIAEAKGVEQKALAMQKLDGVGKEHEEFKLRLEKDKAVQLAQIEVQKDIAQAQANVLGEAFKSANIDIVGGEMTFVDNIMKAINRGKSVDRMLNNSEHLTDMKDALLLGDDSGGGVLSQVRKLLTRSNLQTEDIKNLTMSALLLKLRDNVSSSSERDSASNLLGTVTDMGIGKQLAEVLL
ncbi:MAG: flotillin family protein, partial [Bacteroidota bacterium]